MFGLIVIDLDGNKIGFGKANGRYWSKILSAIILCIGFIMVAFTQRKQGLHDVFAGTFVIKNTNRLSTDIKETQKDEARAVQKTSISVPEKTPSDKTAIYWICGIAALFFSLALGVAYEIDQYSRGGDHLSKDLLNQIGGNASLQIVDSDSFFTGKIANKTRWSLTKVEVRVGYYLEDKKNPVVVEDYSLNMDIPIGSTATFSTLHLDSCSQKQEFDERYLGCGFPALVKRHHSVRFNITYNGG